MSGQCVDYATPSRGCPPGQILREDGACIAVGSVFRLADARASGYSPSSAAFLSLGDIIGGAKWLGGKIFGGDEGNGGQPQRFAKPTLGLAAHGRQDCRWPQRPDPITGRCRTFVGQQPGREPGGVGGGNAVVGGFNMPAMTPDVVGNISRTDGTTGPILRCPTGTVLATDNLCYAKGTKGLAAHRKWKPGTKPFLGGGDVKCLRRANTLRSSKGNKKLLRELGMG